MFLCNYKAVYGGNFLPSLIAIEDGLKNHEISTIYVFPEEVRNCSWYKTMGDMGKTIITCDFSCSKLRFFKTIRTIVNQHKVSILHTHFCSFTVVEALGYIDPKLKIIIHIHSDFDAGNYGWKQKLRDYLVYRLFSQRVNFISVSSSIVSRNPKKIEWIPNALAQDRLTCTHTEGTQIRKALNIDANDILVELFGWSANVKGVDIAVNAVKLINKYASNHVKLAIICGSEMTPEKMKHWIAKHTDCSGDELFLCYLEPTEDVFSYHEAADILLSASRSEGFPYSVLEMLSLGKRCVISDIPGTSWAQEYDTVLSFETGNADACAKALMNAIETLPVEMKNVAELIAQRHNIQDWVSSVLQVYGIK